MSTDEQQSQEQRDKAREERMRAARFTIFVDKLGSKLERLRQYPFLQTCSQFGEVEVKRLSEVMQRHGRDENALENMKIPGDCVLRVLSFIPSHFTPTWRRPPPPKESKVSTDVVQTKIDNGLVPPASNNSKTLLKLMCCSSQLLYMVAECKNLTIDKESPEFREAVSRAQEQKQKFMEFVRDFEKQQRGEKVVVVKKPKSGKVASDSESCSSCSSADSDESD